VRLTVDTSLCQGHGVCALGAPALLDVDDDGYGTVVADPVPARLEDLARRIVAACPEKAIAVTD